MSDMMTLLQAQTWIPGSELVGDGETLVKRVHTDTRTLEAGDFFVALKGERFDGGEFLEQAARKGAVAAICETASRPMLTRSGLPGLVVPDAKEALGWLAAQWRNQFNLPLIAVTGSNGKTTVTQMISSILGVWKGEAALSTQGNLNNEIGVPLTLLRLRPSHQVAVVELGMNHPGEIARLARMANATVALVNNAQREHLEFMVTVEAVARENGAVIEVLGPCGMAVFPANDEYSQLWKGLCAGRPFMTFVDSLEAFDTADVRGEGQWEDGAWTVQASTPGGDMAFRLAIAGRHNVRNALAAVSCALAAGVPLVDVRLGLEAFQPVKGRSRAISVMLAGRSITVVDDTYNANPDSVKAAIDVLVELPGPRLLVLGDMGEVGDQGSKFHSEVGAYASECGVDRLFTLGALSSFATPNVEKGRHFEDISSLIDAVLLVLPTFASVVVKGSRFMKMERVVDAITRYAAEQPEGLNHAA